MDVHKGSAPCDDARVRPRILQPIWLSAQTEPKCGAVRWRMHICMHSQMIVVHAQLKCGGAPVFCTARAFCQRASIVRRVAAPTAVRTAPRSGDGALGSKCWIQCKTVPSSPRGAIRMAEKHISWPDRTPANSMSGSVLCEVESTKPCWAGHTKRETIQSAEKRAPPVSRFATDGKGTSMT